MRLDLGSQASQAVAKEPMLAGPAVPVLPQVRAPMGLPGAGQVEAEVEQLQAQALLA
jgi:hypothetical protein